MYIPFSGFFNQWARSKGTDFLPEDAQQEYLQPRYEVTPGAVLGVIVVAVLLVALAVLILM